MSEENRNQHVDLFAKHMENYNVEASALHRKLQSKAEALKIMREELERFRTERDQFKLMAETLQLRYSAIRRSPNFNMLGYAGKTSVAEILNDTREKNMKLTTEVESLRQKLAELQGDIKLLREKHCKESFGDSTMKSGKNSVGGGAECCIHQKDELEWKNEKSDFINHLENLRRKNAQLAFDLKILIDEKEEAVTERDAYKCKSHRLNHELMIALKANESHPRSVDIDGLILENKFLQEKLKSCENELELVQQSANKYKSMLDTKRKKGIIKLGTNSIDNIMSHKQVKAILENGTDFPPKTHTIADLKSLCLALLDNLNDKNLALNHQKRTNKILATRIVELEQRIQLLMGCDNESQSFSPSQILLSGYCSSSVDCEPKSSNVTEDSGTMSSEESNKTSHVSYDDGMDSLSSESSNRSILSSEYGNPGTIGEVSSMYSLKNNPTTENIEKVNSEVSRERLEDLKDLPPELAELVQKSLHELDMKEIQQQNNGKE